MTDASDEKSKRCKNESDSSQPSSQSPPKLVSKSCDNFGQ